MLKSRSGGPVDTRRTNINHNLWSRNASWLLKALVRFNNISVVVYEFQLAEEWVQRTKLPQQVNLSSSVLGRNLRVLCFLRFRVHGGTKHLQRIGSYLHSNLLCHCFIASASTMTNTAVVTEILNYFKKVPFKLLGKAEA